MKFFTLSALLVAALFAAVVTIPFLPGTHAQSDPFAFEVRMASTTPGMVQVYYDTGLGFREIDSTKVPLSRDNQPELYRLSLPAGSYTSFRFDPIDRDGAVVIASARIVGPGGKVIREIPLSEFKPLNQIKSLTPSPEGLRVDLVPGSTDSQLDLAFVNPVKLSASRLDEVMKNLPVWLPASGGVFVALVLILLALDRLAALRRFLAALFRWTSARPAWAVAIVAAASVAASSYPVIFLGKSYVSPNFGTILLYDTYPTLPGYTDSHPMDVKGSDIGALMWQFVPFSMVQHRAVFRDAEWPVWNRNNSCGIPLLGQGYSMFGDPLHFIPVLANGSAWSWDIKFLVAKWLLALGIGLTVLTLTKHLPAASIAAFAIPFAGFFVYRVNHPAFFSFCYAPWPLYCWLRSARAPNLKGGALWAGGLILANFSLLNTGTVKESYMIFLSINFSGLAALLAMDAPWKIRRERLALLGWAAFLFCLFASPVWLNFVETLRNAYTSYDVPSAFQIRPGILIGLFDEIFYRSLSHSQNVFNPSANFLILAGLLYFFATLRRHADGPTIAIAATSLLPLAFAFGFIPSAWIERMPFIANVAHIDNSFSCALIILWAVLAGVGFAAAAKRLGTREGPGDLVVAGLMLFLIVVNFIAFCQVVHRDVFGTDTTFAPLHPGETLPVTPFARYYLASLLAATLALGLLARHALARSRVSAAAGLGFALCLCTLLWRGGLQSQGVGFEDYVVRPTLRTDLNATSPTIDYLKAAQGREPSRTVGYDNNFFPGWTDVYGLEGINGPDALINPRYRELMGVSPLDQVWTWRLYLSRDRVPAARPLLDFLNVRYYVGLPGGPVAPGSGLRLNLTADMDVQESPTAWPRAFFTDIVSSYTLPAELVQQVGSGDGRPFAAMRTADLAADSSLSRYLGKLENRTVVPASNYSLTEDSTSFSIAAPKAGLAVLSEAWWPGYPHAEVDGKKAHLVRVNHAFQGVIIETAGLHRVTVRYRPKDFDLSLGLSIASLVLMAGSFVWIGRREKRPPLSEAGA